MGQAVEHKSGYVAELGGAFMFLTRLPVPQSLFTQGFPSLQASLWAFSIVGLIVGLLGAGAIMASLTMGLSDLLAIMAGLLVMVLATGGLHDDGLADLADGFGSHKSGEEIARIMKDSVIGSYGTLALIFITIIRLSAMSALIDQPLWLLLPLACAIGRYFVLIALISTPLSPYASLGKMLQKPNNRPVIFGAIVIMVIMIACGFWPSIAGLLAAFISFIIIRALAMRKIKGLTGDVMGAMILCAETSFLIGYSSYV